MSQTSSVRIPVYFVPGLAASPDIFEHISLPEDRFECRFLEWFLPEPDMTLRQYAAQMAGQITHRSPVLIGVSFGGMLVQEMAEFVQPRQVIIISSIKCRHEMPRRLLLARVTRLHKILPTSLVNQVDILARFAFGDPVKKRVHLYQRYLAMRDPAYLDWAIDRIVNWDREAALPDLVHLHGDRDSVFPYAYIGPCIPVPGGTHTMIIHRFRWFNEHLPAIILQDRSSI